MYAEFSLEGLYRADAKTRAEYWTAMKNLGVVDVDYIAARENLPKPPEPPAEPVFTPPTLNAGEKQAFTTDVLGTPAVPPKVAAMQTAMKATAGKLK